MISGGLVAIPEHCVVEKIGKRREGTIQAGLTGGPPVTVPKDERDIFGSDIPDPGIEKQALVIENKPGLK
jgi:hypothetical protein